MLSLDCCPPYAELLCCSNFSFLTGASHPEELIAQAQALGYAALAIADECSLAGVVRAHAAAAEVGFKLIIGTQMRLQAPTMDAPLLEAACEVGDEAAGETPVAQDAAEANLLALPAAEMRLLLLATSQRGYALLSRWITLARLRAGKGEYRACPEDLEGRTPGALFLAGLPDCLAVLLPEPQQSFSTMYAQAAWLRRWFGDRAALGMAMLCRPEEPRLQRRLERLAAFTGLTITAVGDVLMHSRARKPLQDVLTEIGRAHV